MKRIITYSLSGEHPNSNGYYAQIAGYTDSWLAETLPIIAGIVDGFRCERIRRGLPDRPPASCAFELLVLGVLLREHGSESVRLPGWGELLLRGLLRVQERWPKGEAMVKAARGLAYRLAHSLNGRRLSTGSSLEALLAWLKAIGEANLADRLEEWRIYFQKQANFPEPILQCLSLANDFEKSSLEALGKYTLNVESYLQQEAPHFRWRYDSALLSRSRLEYHLSMLGNEILNRDYRQAFRESKQKIVILPPCMRAQPEEKCEAVLTPFGEKCAACTPSCRIHQVTKLGEKRGFGVFMIPEELRIFGGGTGAGGSVGIVGISCVLTNWPGGWDAERLGIPAQGVLLDYVGCKYHWDKGGFPTDINLQKLKSTLDLD